MSKPIYCINYPGIHKPSMESIERAVRNNEVPVVIRKGYDFAGWFTEAECINKVEPDTESDNTYYAGWTEWNEAKKAMMAEFDEIVDEARYLCARPKAFTWESFVPYYRAANVIMFSYEAVGKEIDDEAMRIVREMPALKEKLVKVAEPEDTIWYIWGENMPESDEAKDYDFYYCFDRKGFRPFLVPFMLDDQSKVKGNIIAIAGGGFAQRWNQTEGWPIASEFNKLGYNVFVLQRRIRPYDTIDTFLDLQRAVRFLKFNAEKYGIGRIEHIATAGFSGGGMTINGQLEKCYGDVLPSKYYPKYVDDEVDKVNSDYEVAMPIYGAYCPDPELTDNKHIPAIFAVTGARDVLMENIGGQDKFMRVLYSKPYFDIELHVFAGADHGFGTAMGVGPEHHQVGLGTYGADRWMELADEFMNVRFGYVSQFYKKGERPVAEVK